MGLEERRKREKEARRRAILKAARKLFFEKGFQFITVENIAKKAELSKGAVYLHFNSKEEICAEILMNDIDKFNGTLSIIFEEDRSAAEMLRHFVEVYINFFLNDRELFRILMNFMLHTDQLNFSEGLAKQLIDTTNKPINVIEQIFQIGIDKGEFLPHVNNRQNRNALWGFMNGIISLYIFTGKESIRDQRIRSTVDKGLDLIIRGLSCSQTPEAGLKGGSAAINMKREKR
ncbi:MAG TPA: TetR/AcrR family transcriptional regulator [Syntrophales bacterium]|nr:TetR/AcrR family transcriptional regulator [Syntrophales bacterium]